jgi:uncharacterized membrane-anchored protein
MKIPLALLFAAMVAVQLAVPLHSIYEHERVAVVGKGYLFRATVVDPYDPFRGRYITLGFGNSRIVVDTLQGWPETGGYTPAYVSFRIDNEGFAQIADVRPQAPETDDYLKAECQANRIGDSTELFIVYPFTRFYMEEFKAPEAERIYREATSDPAREVRALVRVWRGKAVLTDVQVDGASLRDPEKFQKPVGE